jgi:hypothetical protein
LVLLKGPSATSLVGVAGRGEASPACSRFRASRPEEEEAAVMMPMERSVREKISDVRCLQTPPCAARRRGRS